MVESILRRRIEVSGTDISVDKRQSRCPRLYLCEAIRSGLVRHLQRRQIPIRASEQRRGGGRMLGEREQPRIRVRGCEAEPKRTGLSSTQPETSASPCRVCRRVAREVVGNHNHDWNLHPHRESLFRSVTDLDNEKKKFIYFLFSVYTPYTHGVHGRYSILLRGSAGKIHDPWTRERQTASSIIVELLLAPQKREREEDGIT